MDFINLSCLTTEELADYAARFYTKRMMNEYRELMVIMSDRAILQALQDIKKQKLN